MRHWRLTIATVCVIIIIAIIIIILLLLLILLILLFLFLLLRLQVLSRVLGLAHTDFVIAFSGLRPINKCNRIFKYADDCDLAVPASSITTTEIELEHINA